MPQITDYGAPLVIGVMHQFSLCSFGLAMVTPSEPVTNNDVVAFKTFAGHIENACRIQRTDLGWGAPKHQAKIDRSLALAASIADRVPALRTALVRAFEDSQAQASRATQPQAGQACRATIKVRKPVNQDEKLSALAA